MRVEFPLQSTGSLSSLFAIRGFDLTNLHSRPSTTTSGTSVNLAFRENAIRLANLPYRPRGFAGCIGLLHRGDIGHCKPASLLSHNVCYSLRFAPICSVIISLIGPPGVTESLIDSLSRGAVITFIILVDLTLLAVRRIRYTQLEIA